MFETLEPRSIALLLGLAVALAGLAWWVRQRTTRGVASRVDDGDSFEVTRRWPAGAVRIRLAWIDAPEHGQPHADGARAALRVLLKNRPLRLRFIDTDRYGRRVTQVHAGGVDVGLRLLEGGWAWHYTDYAGGQGWLARQRYAGAERRARRAGLGLWAESRPTAPWDYRHRPWWRTWLGR